MFNKSVKPQENRSIKQLVELFITQINELHDNSVIVESIEKDYFPRLFFKLIKDEEEVQLKVEHDGTDYNLWYRNKNEEEKLKVQLNRDDIVYWSFSRKLSLPELQDMEEIEIEDIDEDHNKIISILE